MEKRFAGIWTKDEEAQLAKLAKVWKRLDQQIRDQTAERDALKAQMQEILKEKQQSEAPAGLFRISWKQSISRIFDQAAFKAAHAQLYAQYQKESPRQSFTIS